MRKMLTELGPDIFLAVETSERINNRLQCIIDSTGYNCESVFRTKTTGGGVAIIFNDARQNVQIIDYINVPEGVEAIWALVTPKQMKLKLL